MATPARGKHDGRSSLAAIAAVLVVGVALGAMILSMGRSKHSPQDDDTPSRSEEHTSELQSLAYLRMPSSA